MRRWIMGRESDAVWMEEIQRDIDRFMGGILEPEGICREILVSRSSVYRLRQVEFEPSGVMEFKVSMDILVTLEIDGGFNDDQCDYVLVQR